MKSNDEFIAGIYAKAELRKNESDVETTKVVKINSFHRKAKKNIAYVAGFAACFVCGIVVSMSMGTDKSTTDSPNAHQIRKIDEGMMIGEDTTQYLHCQITSSKEEDGIYHLGIRIMNASEGQGVEGVLFATPDLTTGWEKMGNEIVVRVFKPDSLNHYTIVSNSEVFVYDSTQNGVKMFKSSSNTVLKETDITN